MAEYIDRSKIAEMLNAVYEDGWTTKYSVEMCLNLAQKTLLSLPAADVEEVKHGQWVFDASTIIPRCTVCGEDAIAETVSPYCPWCGAKLDEEDENGRD